MKKRFYLLVIFALLVQPSLGTSAREMGEGVQAPEQTTLYVKPGGTGDCSDWDHACGLQTALGLAASGDQIWVAQGIYKPTDGIPFTSCQEIREAVPDSPDGEYLIDIGGNAAQVYCADMAGEPKEYLTLSEENYSQYTAGGASPGTNVRTTYTRVRLLPDTLQVDTSDQSYSSSTGSLNHGSTTVTSMPYAVAMDCFDNGSSTGEARIDLRYTAFAVSAGETFSLGGFIPAGTATLSEGNQVVQMTGGGFCGWMNPSPGVYQPFNNRGGPILELEYRPERRASFWLESGVALYGGFDPDSGVDTFEERNPADYITVLSGDIDGNDITDPNGVVTDTANIQGANAYHVVIASEVDGTAILDGFTITAGNADGDTWPQWDGGGMYNTWASPSLADITFAGNAAEHGGGLYNDNSTPTLTDCTFLGNSSSFDGGGMHNWYSSPSLTNVSFIDNTAVTEGGGMFNIGASPPLTNCTFDGNLAGDGGGMYNRVSSSPPLTNCTFEGNLAMDEGGGMFNRESSSPALTDVIFINNTAVTEGGGMRNIDSNSTLINVSFIDNQAGWGAGMSNQWSDPWLINAVFRGNAVPYDGGAIHNYNDSSPTLIHVTLAGNSAGNGGGLDSWDSSAPNLINTILWGNTATTEGDQIFNPGWGGVNVSYSLVEGDCPTGVTCDHLLSDDPQFVDAAGGDLHLSPGSPAIDAGDNAEPDLPPFDFEGDPRLVDGDHDGMPTVDMGADEFYEAPPPVIYVDQDATGANSGVSWEDAFTNLQAALAWTEAGTEIWVAQGVYTPTLKTDPGDVRSATFQLKSGVALYGGFEPDDGADTFEERHPAAYPSVLSGEIGTPEQTSDNSYHVVTGNAVAAMSSLDGFTITAGYAWGSDGGGGVYNPVGSLDIRNAIFTGNEAYMGGGIFNTGTLTVTHSMLSDNWAGYGGGIANLIGGSLTLLTSTVGPGNNVYTMGGGVHNEGSMVIFDSTVVGNSGTGSVGGAGIANLGTLEVTNTTISGNYTNQDGGGIWHAGGLLVLTNATITANIADHDQDGWGMGAGIFEPGGGPILAINTIIADNRLGLSAPSDCAPFALPLLSLGYNLDSDGSCLVFLPGIGDKPFTDPLLGPLADHGGPTLTHALLPGSPAIDAGSCPGYTADQRGYPRPVDLPGVANVNDGCDMGAFEVQLLVLYLPIVVR